MNEAQAGEIAHLLNTQNKLVIHYDAERVLEAADNYLCELSEENRVIACVELKRVQWYQFEIDHLTVNPNFAGQGFARKLLERAEAQAIDAGGRLLQCTIRDDNERSQHVFSENGFGQVARFHYPNSGNNVGVWQKVISPAIEKAAPALA